MRCSSESYCTVFMSDYHTHQLAQLAVHAYLVASNTVLESKRRAKCIEFLHTLNPQIIELNYEGHIFYMPTAIYNVLSIIRDRSTALAYAELLRFYPELANDEWPQEAIESNLFKLDKPVT